MTNTIKYSLGALVILLLLYFTNQSSQKSYSLVGNPIFSGNNEEIFRILLTENDDVLELVRSDTTWSITQADSFKVKDF